MQNTSCIYRECMRNHAAKLGSYAIDGCREYSQAITGDLCAACGCHRSYHRRVEVKPYGEEVDTTTHARFPYTSLRRVKQFARMKWKLKAEMKEEEEEETSTDDKMMMMVKRRKSKFTEEQREAMREYATKLGWTLKDKRAIRDEIRSFCEGIGVSRYLFKTWVNNNKKFYH